VLGNWDRKGKSWRRNKKDTAEKKVQVHCLTAFREGRKKERGEEWGGN